MARSRGGDAAAPRPLPRSAGRRAKRRGPGLVVDRGWRAARRGRIGRRGPRFAPNDAGDGAGIGREGVLA
eukprot:7108953-Lingulodinium_polyedra.AAC.1